MCTHGRAYDTRGDGHRTHNTVRNTNCASGNHNHGLNSPAWSSYAENRKEKDPQLANDVAILHKAGTNAQTGELFSTFGIELGCTYQSKKKILRDMHNMVQLPVVHQWWLFGHPLLVYLLLTFK
ncbi:hypothetical protein PHMEG_00038737 [Phytophthora megakarya]|uniref:Uncharacterized protein n=1 Tax=Phytophthora megakarya TaxID=4795 RepID=A0A225UI92_9STRA|nr:hypothetical protein PHMEG_00038737 [Phytophthora megakarya]